MPVPNKPLPVINIKELDISKTEGTDGITNAMIKNLPQAGKDKLLTIYNNIPLSGCIPEDWKIGEIVLILKKNPPTDIENYRPITLTSCRNRTQEFKYLGVLQKHGLKSSVTCNAQNKVEKAINYKGIF